MDFLLRFDYLDSARALAPAQVTDATSGRILAPDEPHTPSGMVRTVSADDKKSRPVGGF